VVFLKQENSGEISEDVKSILGTSRFPPPTNHFSKKNIMATETDVAIELQHTEISVEGSYKKDEKASLTEVQAISV
jgi:hypothetical protein